jgi:hypothetical protein
LGTATAVVKAATIAAIAMSIPRFPSSFTVGIDAVFIDQFESELSERLAISRGGIYRMNALRGDQAGSRTLHVHFSKCVDISEYG